MNKNNNLRRLSPRTILLSIGIVVLLLISAPLVLNQNNDTPKVEASEETIWEVAEEHIKTEYPESDIMYDGEVERNQPGEWNVSGFFYPDESNKYSHYSMTIYYDESNDRFEIKDYQLDFE